MGISEQLMIRPVTNNDAEWLNELLSDEEVRRFMPHIERNADRLIANMLKADERGLGYMKIILFESTPAGFIAVYDINDNPFLFYAMRKSFRNKGIMTGVIKSMIPTLPVSITTLIHEDNKASRRVIAKSGLLKIKMVPMVRTVCKCEKYI